MNRRTPKRLWINISISVAFVLISAFSLWYPAERSVKAASTGTTGLLNIQGSGGGTAQGDYVSASLGLNKAYHYFIEVPPGLSRLKVDIFDADVGMGGAAETDQGRDRAVSGFNSSASYTLIHPSGTKRNTTFNTGDATGPTGADNAWLTFYDSTGDNFRDNFSTASYANNDGSVDWSTNWIETNDNGSASTGLIQITGGELRIEDNGDASPSTIEREANLAANGFSDATLSFDFHTANLETGDTVLAQVSNNGGSTWNTLETFTAPLAPASRSYDIGAYIASNTRVRFITSGTSFSGDDAFFVDNVEIKTSFIVAGHWEVRVDMSSSVTTGSDVNAFGLRASDGDSTAGGTELNIYADSFYGIGVNAPATGTNSRAYTMYPYISSGCSCSKNDFDYDSDSGTVGSLSLTSPLTDFIQTYNSSSLSTNNTWRRDSFTGWTSDAVSDDYGIWTADAVIDSYVSSTVPTANLADLYFANFQASANPPMANPQTNAFRIYLPNDAGGVPSETHVDQRAIGPSTTITTGHSAEVVIWIQVWSPTSHAITFSSSNLVTANVPGAGAVYDGRAAVSQGTIVSQPSIGGTGNITWNPGTVAAGSRAVLMYYVNVSPTAAGQRIPLTGTPASGKGTEAKFVDQTDNTTQTRATYTFGPLCEVAATEGILLPSHYPIGQCLMSSLPNGTKNQSYDQSVSSLDPVLVSGSLPPGLSIVGTHISGTPTTTGTFNFSLMTGNPVVLCASSRAYSVTISAPTAANGTIEGVVTSDSGAPLEGTVIFLNGTQTRKTITGANGKYQFDNVETEGFYTVTPARPNYRFNPLNRSFSQLGNQTLAGFSGTLTGQRVNPLDTTEYFVRQQYVDFLNREPDEAGLNFWTDNIESCGLDAQCRDVKRVDTSAAFFLSQEFQRTGYLVYRTYQAAYGEMPNAPVPLLLSEFKLDAHEIGNGVIVNQADWQTTLEANTKEFMSEFVQRDRFTAAYPTTLGPAEFVDGMFRNAGITPSENDRSAAVNEFGGASTSVDVSARARALRDVAENALFNQQEFNRAFVLMQYFGYLRRNPNDAPDVDYTGFDFWLSKLDQFNGNYVSAEMVRAFINSNEYRQRFGL